MSDRITFPSDWIAASIKDIVDPSRAITYGIVQPGPRFDPARGVPMIRGQDYSSGTVRADDLYYVDPRLAASFSRASVRGGDLLISIVGYVGTVAEVPNDLDGANLTQTTARVAVREDIKGRYFLHYLKSHYFEGEVKRFTKGSAQPGLNLADVAVMRVVYPRDASDRATIAKVLDTLDITIHQTEAIVEKLKQVKQGLLHDLLTRGIDANGELRPPQSQAAHLYMNSPLGWIPHKWRVLPVSELGELVTGSTPPSHEKKAWGAGLPFITPGDVVEDQPIHDSNRSVSEDGRRFVRVLPSRSVVVTCIGILGRVGITSTEACTNQQINALITSSEVQPEFAALAIRRNRNQLQVVAGLQVIPIVNKSEFGRMVIPIPSREEQSEIVRRLHALDSRLLTELLTMKKMLSQKSGLMDDLLTGRVRVAPLLGNTA